MKDDEKQDVVPEGEGAETSHKDPFVKMIRDLPRLRSIEAEPGSKPYVPPPPTASRMGAIAQGCGGVLLIIMAVPMIMVAMAFGYYLWGPGLMLVGGLVLALGVGGLWRGRKTPVVVGILVIIPVLIIAYTWRYFIFAVAILSPLGTITDLIFGLGLMIGIMALVATLFVHVISLFYWKRLQSPTRTTVIFWAVVLVVLAVLPPIVSVMEQGQREDWLNEHREDWQDKAQTDRIIMGVNTGVSLGYSFANVNSNETETTDSDVEFDVRKAELAAAIETGASPIRVAASGDTILEQRRPRLFVDEDEDDEDATPVPDDATGTPAQSEELKQLITYETEYMDLIAESGADLFLTDSQYSPYLLSQANDDDKIAWDEFTQLHEERIRHYASTLKPAVYAVVNEPGAYVQYSGLEEPDDDDESLDAWIEHTQALIEIVQEESPETRIGVTVSFDRDFDMEYYERVLELDGVDLITIDLYQTAAFQVVEDAMEERGHPADFGKELWLSETWYGFCMAPQRSMDLDSLWLKTVVAFAAKERISAVLPTSFGCFLQSGGTLLNPSVNLDGRTAVWKTWKELVETWQTPLAAVE